MKLNLKSLLSLKTSVLIAFLLLWNTGFFLAMYLGGGGLQGGLTPVGMEVTSYICTAACVFCLLIATQKQVQNVLIEPTRAENFDTKEFYFVALITGAIAIQRLLFQLTDSGVNAL